MTTPVSVSPEISRAEMRQLIRLRGDYTNVRRFPNDYLNAEIQSAFGHFWRIVDEAHQGWWDKEDTITTAANVPYATLPVDCKTVKATDRLDGDEYVEMPHIGLADRNRFGSASGKPLAVRMSARGFELYPKPNAVYTIRVMYSPKAPALTENERRDWYDGWQDYVVEKVLYELDSREGKPMGDRTEKLERAEKALRASTSERRQAEPEYLRLREGSDDPFNDDGILG